MSDSLVTRHNYDIPMLPADQRLIVWLGVGQAIFLSNNQMLSLQTERDADSGDTQPVFHVLGQRGVISAASTPEDLRAFTSDAVVRAIESQDGVPTRALVEIGEMAAFPRLRANAA